MDLHGRAIENGVPKACRLNLQRRARDVSYPACNDERVQYRCLERPRVRSGMGSLGDGKRIDWSSIVRGDAYRKHILVSDQRLNGRPSDVSVRFYADLAIAKCEHR